LYIQKICEKYLKKYERDRCIVIVVNYSNVNWPGSHALSNK